MLQFRKTFFVVISAFAIVLTLDSCGSSGSKIRTTKTSDDGKNFKLYKSSGIASYYHDKFNGRKTASGERFSNSEYTAAHKELNFGTRVKVTNIANDKSVIVKINDRGPFTKGREIDLSKKAFFEIANSKYAGHIMVDLELVEE